MSFSNQKYNVRFVALYLRKSRAESKKDLEKHRMVLTELCKRNNFKYVEYIEVGTSDSIDMRPEISKLLKEVEDGVYDAVCVVEYDRLGRGDLGEQDRIKKAFQKSATLIITPDKIYDLNNDIDDTYADFKGLLARQEYKMINKRLQQGKKIGARRGQWTNGIPPFPYVYQRFREKYNEKGIVVHDERLTVYRSIIEMALQGISPTKIAEHLNQNGLFTTKGNYWSGVTIHRLLVDETHLGKIISNKTEGDASKNKRPNAKPFRILPRNEWVIVDNCHEAVKTLEEHEAIISIINQRQKIPVKSRKQTHSLTNLVKCAKCEHSHSLHTVDGSAYIKPCWYKDRLGNKCRNAGILSDTLEKIVLDEISKYKNEFISSTCENDAQLYNRITNMICDNEALLAKYQKALNTVNDAYDLGDYGRDEWIRRKEKWNLAIENVTSEIYELKKQLQATQQKTNEERIGNLSYFFDNITTATGGKERNDLYKTIIERILYQRDGDNINIKIIFK